MSREIKFRAWDNKNRQFADYEDIEECLSCQDKDGWKSSDGIGCCFGINAVEVLADCIIEQYTGLKDINGKEIYEGDIVKKYDDGDIAPVIGIVEFCKSGARFGVNGGRHLLSQRWEVIGNIHENKELLEN